MYERFTVRARKAMALADQEARRFGHRYIGTEHILLGLLKEGTGVGAWALKRLDVDFQKMIAKIEELIGPSADDETAASEEMPHTDRAKQALKCAVQEARNLAHNYIGTEHLLLGLLHDSDGVTPKLLNPLGVDIQAARRSILNLLGGSPDATDDQET